MSKQGGLMDSVMSILQTGEAPEPSLADTMPEDPNHNIKEVNLGDKHPVWQEVRQRLQEIENELTTDLREELRVLNDEFAEELAIAQRGDRSVEELTAEGLTRQEIVEVRAASQIALEVMETKETAIERVEAEIDKVRKAWASKRDRCTKTLHLLEVATRAWLLDLVSGTNYNKMNPEKAIRQYGALLHAEEFTAEVLGDPALAARAVKELGTFETPDNVWETVMAVTPEKYREQFEPDNTPLEVLKRLDNAINSKEQ